MAMGERGWGLAKGGKAVRPTPASPSEKVHVIMSKVAKTHTRGMKVGGVAKGGHNGLAK